MMRIVVLCSVLSGALVAVASGSLASSELALFSSLSHQLIGGDIPLGGRGFGSYPLIAWVKLSLGVDFIGRTTRRADGRRRRTRLARNDWLIVWKGSATPSPGSVPCSGPGYPKK